MPDQMLDSREAARSAAVALVQAALVGLLSGAATWAFLAVDHLGMHFLWTELPEMLQGVPPELVSVGIVVAMTALAALMVQVSKGRPYDLGLAEAEFDREGRIDYRKLPAGVVFSLASLFSGAAVGPEAPLTDISGGMGTWFADRLKADPARVRLLAYSGVAGAFGAFFGFAPVGALLAAELISPKSTSISRLDIAAGLASGSVGYVVYVVLGGAAVGPILAFPGTAQLTVANMAVAVVIGALAALLGLVYGAGLMKARLGLQTVRTRPWIAALLGGSATALVAVFAPLLLFSGQTQTPQIIAQAASIGALMLVVIGVAKLIFSLWSLSSAYFGGPIFPLIFAGTCFGLALTQAVPALPQGVAVMAIVAGMVVAASAAPLSITLFLALITEPTLAPVIAIAAVSGFIVRQAVAPTIPGVYRATRAQEEKAERAREELERELPREV